MNVGASVFSTEEAKAAMCGMPLDPGAVMGSASGSPGHGNCIYCSKPAKEKAIFARAY